MKVSPTLCWRYTLACLVLSLKTASSLAAAAAGGGGSSVGSNNKIVNLQRPHPDRTPSEALQHLHQECQNVLGTSSEELDVYGDFEKGAEESFLRKFEQEIATEFGKEDAVFMPSGGMAQSIALLIHAKSRTSSSDNETPHFACHYTSHLLLHEQEAYRELLQMEPIVISTKDQASGISIPPMMYSDVQQILDDNNTTPKPKTLLLELPHREIGGKLTPWNDVLKLRDYCRQHNIAFHLDGARIFEAATGYDDNNLPLKEIASAFDSVYISFYKGLGGLSGAMLLGDKDFIDQARIWLRRFGGNLYTLLPYAVSGWAGYRRHWCLESHHQKTETLLSFREKKLKLVRIIETLSQDPEISKVVSFDPAVPETSMVHGYLKHSVGECTAALEKVESETGVRVLIRVRPVSVTEPAYQIGYRSRFEWAIGESNGSIPDDAFRKGWRELAKRLSEKEQES